jgi:hypothetical protein
MISLICVFSLCKYGPNLSHKNLNVLWHTHVLCLNTFSMRESNNKPYISLRGPYTTNAHLRTFKTNAHN